MITPWRSHSVRPTWYNPWPRVDLVWVGDATLLCLSDRIPAHVVCIGVTTGWHSVFPLVPGGDPTLLHLPDSTPAPVLMVPPLVITVCVNVVWAGDLTLLCLPDTIPAPMVMLSPLVVTACRCSTKWGSYSVMPTWLNSYPHGNGAKISHKSACWCSTGWRWNSATATWHNPCPCGNGT